MFFFSHKLLQSPFDVKFFLQKSFHQSPDQQHVKDVKSDSTTILLSIKILLL